MEQNAAAPGFEQEILPLFRPVDIDHMAGMGALLDQYSYMSVPENAERVYGTVADQRMPPASSGGPWPEEKVRLLRAWIDGGRRP